ncbi:MAG: hypothetical protein EXS68_02155 [Candidatus Ryanbacteria bacterium]|nr:hypothetical protein [Candidatus Ryanbacteria bacterium]
MNLHPIFVHFPIAFLTIYTLMEFVGFKRLTEHASWFYIKAFLLILGTGSSFAARQTGEMIEAQFRGGPQTKLLEMHALWANITIAFFCGLSLLYLAAWARRDLVQAPMIGRIIALPVISQFMALAGRVYDLFVNSALMMIAALIGLVLMTIVGGLGGALAYGPNIDPVVKFVYDLFF